MSTEAAIAKLGPNAAKYAYLIECEIIAAQMSHPLEKAHFVAQLAHESQGFTTLEENLNYSANRLREVFGKYFPTDELAAQYAHKKELIGNRVYAHRMGNGHESSGDGFRYRGRGFIHLTGRNNYYLASEDIYGDARLGIHPELAAQPRAAARIAVWFWQDRDCGRHALNDDLETVTRLINGGLNGLADRRAWLGKAKQAFGVV